MEFKAAICPNCGADLRLPEDKKVLKCMYCGKDIIVEEAIKKAEPLLEGYLALARTAKNSKNYKEAYAYYNKVLEVNPMNYESWLGKAVCAGWQSTIDDFKVQEVITNFESAIKYSPAEVKASVINETNIVLVSLFNFVNTWIYNNGRFIGNWEIFCKRCQLLVSAWEILYQYEPSDKQVIDNIIDVCKRQIEGVEYDPAPGQGAIFRGYVKITDQYKYNLSQKMGQYVAKRKALDPNYIPPSFKKKSIFR
jgi:tetratricopeptide (TPR) repeat protein